MNLTKCCFLSPKNAIFNGQPILYSCHELRQVPGLGSKEKVLNKQLSQCIIMDRVSGFRRPGFKSILGHGNSPVWDGSKKTFPESITNLENHIRITLNRK